MVLQFAIPFQSRPAAEASHAVWRTGPYRLIVVIATAQLQLQRGHDARDTRPISEVSPSPAMAEYALMRRVSIAIWRLFFGRRRVDRRLAAVLVADVAFVGGGTQGDISRSWRSSQSRSLRSRALAFFGNHDEALAYPRRALALNHRRLPLNFRYALLATEIARGRLAIRSPYSVALDARGVISAMRPYRHMQSRRVAERFFKPSPRGLHIEQRTYGISTGTGSLELSVILFSPDIFTSNVTSETATPSEHDAITRTFGPSSCNDLTVHF